MPRTIKTNKPTLYLLTSRPALLFALLCICALAYVSINASEHSKVLKAFVSRGNNSANATALSDPALGTEVKIPQPVNDGANILVSRNLGGASNGGTNPRLSADGRFVVFESAGPLTQYTALIQNIFLYDLQTGNMRLVSMDNVGTGGADNNCYNPFISDDGRFVTFSSFANNIASANPNHFLNIFVRDMQLGITSLVSVNDMGVSANAHSSGGAITPDGKYVLFQSTATDLVASNTNGIENVFVRDLQTGSTKLVSINMSGSGGGNNASSRGLSDNGRGISNDGRYVIFESKASDLVAGDLNDKIDVFVRDLQTGITSLVSINKTGTGSGNSFSERALISANGRFVVFESISNDLTNTDTTVNKDVFVRDLQTGVTKLVSANIAGTNSGNSHSMSPSISADGRFVSFLSYSSDLIVGDANNVIDLFVRDLQTNTTTLVSVNKTGTGGANSPSPTSLTNYPVISANGRFVIFVSEASDLVNGDNNGIQDLFVRDLVANTTTLVSSNNTNTGSGNGVSANYYPVISATGRTVAYPSWASDLALNDNNQFIDIFANVLNGQFQFSALNYNVSESTGTATITVNRTSGTNGTVSVNFSTSNGSASATNDYSAASGTLTFGPGERSKNFTINIAEDIVDEVDETVHLTLSAPAGETMLGPQSTATLTILDNDPTPVATMTNVSFNEGTSVTTNASLTVSFNSPSSRIITVNYATADGTAKSGLDYEAGAGTLTFAPGETSKTIVVPIIGDSLDEYEESLSVNFSTPNPNYIILPASSSVVVISDDDPSPALSVSNINITEGDSGTTNANFLVSLSSFSGRSISVAYATANGTATSGEDYLSSSGTLTFNPGDTEKTISVPINGDVTVEPNETFNLVLTNPTNATLASAAGNTTIVNDDIAGVLQFTAANYSIGEGASTAAISVSRTNGASGSVSVNYSTSDGTATAGTDYTATSGTVTFANGESSKTITVPIKDDGLFEGNENLILTLSNPTNSSTLGSQSTAALTIVDNDPPPAALQFGQNSYTAGEGVGSLSIIVNRSGDLTMPVAINYLTSDAANFLQNCNVMNGAATSRCDYVGVLGTLRFAAGEISKTISIPIVDDTYAEGAENFSISLSNPTGSAVIGTNQTAPVQITDNGNDGAGQPNPIDNATFFVRQHYIDFLSREPDPASAGWLTQLNGCGAGDQSCRLSVSQGIYGSPEFKDRGYFIYKFFSVGLGRKPSYDEFNVDRARVSGFQTDAELEQSKVDFINDFMGRAEFANAYNGLSNDAYVAKLFDSAGVTQITVAGGVVRTFSAELQLLVGGSITRAQVLRDIAESAEVSAKFLTESTVVMHYFGYLRRDPDAAYQEWINILTSTGDSRKVTEGFINSTEYRARFGQ